MWWRLSHISPIYKLLHPVLRRTHPLYYGNLSQTVQVHFNSWGLWHILFCIYIYILCASSAKRVFQVPSTSTDKSQRIPSSKSCHAIIIAKATSSYKLPKLTQTWWIPTGSFWVACDSGSRLRLQCNVATGRKEIADIYIYIYILNPCASFHQKIGDVNGCKSTKFSCIPKRTCALANGELDGSHFLRDLTWGCYSPTALIFWEVKFGHRGVWRHLRFYFFGIPWFLQTSQGPQC